MHSRGDVTRFNPQYYVDIEEYIDKKIEILKFYDQEMRDAPHARSYDMVRTLAKFRGGEVGLNYAEAFEIIRLLS